MKTITIRKNSTKKIQALLEQASSIKSSTGCFTHGVKEINVEMAMHFLESNYDSVYIKCEEDSNGNVIDMWMGSKKHGGSINVCFNAQLEQSEDPEQELEARIEDELKDAWEEQGLLRDPPPSDHTYKLVQWDDEQPEQEQQVKKVEVKLTNEDLSYAGCYAMNEEQFEAEIENFVYEDENYFYASSKNTINGFECVISHDKGSPKNGELPSCNGNFYVLSKMKPDDEGYLYFDDADCERDELERINSLGYKSLLNIDTCEWRDLLTGDRPSDNFEREERIDSLFESVTDTLLYGEDEPSEMFKSAEIEYEGLEHNIKIQRMGFSGLIMQYESEVEGAAYRIHEVVRGSYKNYRYCFHWMDSKGVINIIEFAFGDCAENNKRFIREAVELLIDVVEDSFYIEALKGVSKTLNQ